jgi:hypothetical protein
MNETTWIAVAFACAAVGFVAHILVLSKLRANGYRYSDLYGLRIYSDYTRTAGELGWSQIPLFLIPVALIGFLLSFLMTVKGFGLK